MSVSKRQRYAENHAVSIQLVAIIFLIIELKEIASNSYNGTLTPWSAWPSCPNTCGTDSRTRSRSCDAPGGVNITVNDTFSCEDPTTENNTCAFPPCPVNGGWSNWTSWTICSITCGDGGTQYHDRECNNPAPAYNGTECAGAQNETRACKIAECPIDGNLTAWSEWGSCSSSCGEGNNTKVRTCTNPSPQYGGQNCAGSTLLWKPCKIAKCKDEIINEEVEAWSNPYIIVIPCALLGIPVLIFSVYGLKTLLSTSNAVAPASK